MRPKLPDKEKTKTTSALVYEAGADVVDVQPHSNEIEHANCKPRLHPVLLPMLQTAQGMWRRGDDRGFDVLTALTILNHKRSFARGSAHHHFGDEEQVSNG